MHSNGPPSDLIIVSHVNYIFQLHHLIFLGTSSHLKYTRVCFDERNAVTCEDVCHFSLFQTRETDLASCHPLQEKKSPTLLSRTGRRQQVSVIGMKKKKEGKAQPLSALKQRAF